MFLDQGVWGSLSLDPEAAYQYYVMSVLLSSYYSTISLLSYYVILNIVIVYKTCIGMGTK